MIPVKKYNKHYMIRHRDSKKANMQIYRKTTLLSDLTVDNIFGVFASDVSLAF